MSATRRHARQSLTSASRRDFLRERSVASGAEVRFSLHLFSLHLEASCRGLVSSSKSQSLHNAVWARAPPSALRDHELGEQASTSRRATREWCSRASSLVHSDRMMAVRRQPPVHSAARRPDRALPAAASRIAQGAEASARDPAFGVGSPMLRPRAETRALNSHTRRCWDGGCGAHVHQRPGRGRRAGGPRAERVPEVTDLCWRGGRGAARTQIGR